MVQRQVEEEEEPIQTKLIYPEHPILQRQEEEPEKEEETLQTKKPLADQITPLVQRQVEEEEKEEEEILQTKGRTGYTPEVAPNLECSINALRGGGGQLLPESVRTYFEPRFGQDFSQVRVHTDARAVESAQAVNALAYTVGRNIVFRAGQYAPGTAEGRRLLAHELTHVVQQGGNGEYIVRRSPDCSEWGGFRICGTASFIRSVRNDLNTLNGTAQGSGVLGAIAANREPWYRSLIRIQSGPCGFLPGSIYYNPSSCGVSNTCGTGSGGWTSVPNYVYLFHEVVHAYLYYIAGRGTHPERECMATGLGSYYTSISYNENQLRCELGLSVRPCYDSYCRGFSPPVC